MPPLQSTAIIPVISCAWFMNSVESERPSNCSARMTRNQEWPDSGSWVCLTTQWKRWFCRNAGVSFSARMSGKQHENGCKTTSIPFHDESQQPNVIPLSPRRRAYPVGETGHESGNGSAREFMSSGVTARSGGGNKGWRYLIPIERLKL